MYVHIDKTPLRMVANPVGEGWAIACERGIPCEGHTVIVSYHVTNSPEKEDIEKVVTQYLPQLQNAWNGFVDFAKNANDIEQNFDILETIGLGVLQVLCRKIVEAAEKELYRRWECSSSKSPS